ncbi:Protein Y71G12A.2 b [Aphelenchoides avenae]|nr:Protein Y71G12A.2 b [Aphelenchus avenae]
MDDCYALKVNKKQPLLLTWNGNEECYRKHSKFLLSLIGDGAISWKREDKRFPYPLHVRFTPKWTKFTESMVLQPSDEVPTCSEVGFVHVFFIYASSVESYRQSVRHEVSDWFSTVNKDDTQWMIIFDSSRAKEKKNRGHLLEKIKSDFARFLHRVHEITDSGERSTVHNAFLPNFAAALDSYAAGATSAILKLKDAADSDAFVPANLVNQWLNLSYFYWSLELLEHVLSELDEMEAFISEAISEHASKEKVPAWVKQMRDLSLGEKCATLEAAMAREKLDVTATLLELRCYVLSQQLLTSMHVFNHRLKEAKGGTSVADDLRHSFLSFLLRYTYEALSHVIEDSIAFKFGKEDMLLHALIVVWYWEAMNLGRYLADVLNTSEAAYFTCLISGLYSQTLTKMCNSLPLDASSRSTLVKWLTVEDIFVVSGFCKELLSMICADHSGLLHRHSAREIRTSIGVLERFGWIRSVDELRFHLAKLLR